MRLSSVFLSLATCAVALAADPDPNDCSGKEKERKGSDFVLTDNGVNPHLKPLSDIFNKTNKITSVKDVFDDGNHKTTTDAGGKRLWEDKPDFSDQKTKKWVPQGITTTADALKEGSYEGKEGWVVSWHRDDDKSVRVTFVEKVTGTYRHVLLVDPSADDNFKEVDCHAGGIMWYGDTLWVVDTNNGIRVFDMNNIWKVDDGDGVGKKKDGGYSAAGYRYVLPQLRLYKWSSPFTFKFSYISLDRTTTPDRLLVGEYRREEKEGEDVKFPMRMVQWELDYTTRTLRSDGKKAAASWAYCVDIPRVQGAVQAHGKIYISRMAVGADGDLFGWIPGKVAYNNRGFLPRLPEDLSYDQRDNKLYGLTEGVGQRYILTIKADDVKFS